MLERFDMFVIWSGHVSADPLWWGDAWFCNIRETCAHAHIQVLVFLICSMCLGSHWFVLLEFHAPVFLYFTYFGYFQVHANAVFLKHMISWFVFVTIGSVAAPTWITKFLTKLVLAIFSNWRACASYERLQTLTSRSIHLCHTYKGLTKVSLSTYKCSCMWGFRDIIPICARIPFNNPSSDY